MQCGAGLMWPVTHAVGPPMGGGQCQNDASRAADTHVGTWVSVFSWQTVTLQTCCLQSGWVTTGGKSNEGAVPDCVSSSRNENGVKRWDSCIAQIVSGEAPRISSVHAARLVYKGLYVASCGGGGGGRL